MDFQPYLSKYVSPNEITYHWYEYGSKYSNKWRLCFRLLIMLREIKVFSSNLSWVFYFRTKKATSSGEKILTPNVVIETFYHHHHFNIRVLSFQVYTKYLFCTLHHTKNLRTLCKNGYCTILWRWYLIAPVVATFHYRLSGNQK